MPTPNGHPFSLAGKHILIAGGASGIGASAAAICAGLGATLVLADIGDAAPVAEKLRSEGHEASAVACDVTDRGAVERVVSEAGALDHCVHPDGSHTLAIEQLVRGTEQVLLRLRPGGLRAARATGRGRFEGFTVGHGRPPEIN